MKRTKKNINTITMEPEGKPKLEPGLESWEWQAHQPDRKIVRELRFNIYRSVGVKDKSVFITDNSETPQQVTDVVGYSGYIHVERRNINAYSQENHQTINEKVPSEHALSEENVNISKIRSNTIYQKIVTSDYFRVIYMPESFGVKIDVVGNVIKT